MSRSVVVVEVVAPGTGSFLLSRFVIGSQSMLGGTFFRRVRCEGDNDDDDEVDGNTDDRDVGEGGDSHCEYKASGDPLSVGGVVCDGDDDACEWK